MFRLLIPALIMLLFNDNFKTEQLNNSRVKDAYATKETSLEALLKSKNISMSSLEIYLRAYKQEKLLEVWARNKTDKKFQLLINYPICQSSGTLGPKRKEGDLQVPEGFYQINHFNPLSNYHLSLGLNYPNKSDRIFADKSHPGGAIYIHGSCVTIGCIPITDDKIKELYVLCVEARNNGQKAIQVTICPAKLTANNYAKLKQLKNVNKNTIDLWYDLKVDYECFERTGIPNAVEFLANGRHIVREQN